MRDVTKGDWCAMVWGLMDNDPRCNVKRIEYMTGLPQRGDETVEVEYYSGYMARINVTANSLGAILHEIVAEVYGPGALGTYWRGFRKKEKEEA